MIIKHKFHDKFDLRDLMLKLIDGNKIDTAKNLIMKEP